MNNNTMFLPFCTLNHPSVPLYYKDQYTFLKWGAFFTPPFFMVSLRQQGIFRAVLNDPG